MSRIIIMEGCDKAGKTTLANYIVDTFGYKYFKSTKQAGSGVNLEQALKYDWRFLLDYLDSVGHDDVIFDRSFISQFAYSLTYRGGNVFDEYNGNENYLNLIQQYTNRLSKFNHLVIHCVRKNYNGVKDEVVDLDKAEELKGYFAYYFNNIGINLNVLTCNFEDGIEANQQKIMELL